MRIEAVNAFTYTAETKEKVKIQLTGSEARQAASEGRADVLTLSDEAKAALDKLGRQVEKQNDLSGQIYYMKTELENSKKAAEAQADEATHKLKMLEIARRLQHGDKVPPEDERALMEYDDKLYQVSKQIGLMKELEERKEYDSLLDDDEGTEEDIKSTADRPAELGVQIEGVADAEAAADDVSEVQLE